MIQEEHQPECERVTHPNSLHPCDCRHGVNCPKRRHYDDCAYLHSSDDDSPYDVDGVMYCGRCHRALEGSVPA